MAKGSANPADAFRKAQRAKELKKNKEDRKKAREGQVVKRDTRELESEIKHLKEQGKGKKLPDASHSRLKELESELAYVTKVKERYVADHPEARSQVFRTHTDRSNRPPRPAGEAGDEDGAGPSAHLAHLYDEQGRLRDPRRSVYYHETYNPYGVPPPGMPYRERTATPVEEEDEEDEEDDEDDDEIVMPEGPPPGAEDSEEDSDDSDDIPLPPGPPPPKNPSAPPTGPRSNVPQMAPPPLPQMALPLNFASMVPNTEPVSWGAHYADPIPPPQPHIQPPRPPRPQYRVPQQMQDPLSDEPTTTYQGYRAAKHELPARPANAGPPSGTPSGPSSTLPARPPGAATISAAPTAVASAEIKPAGSATISAEPQLRDLRKEATVFVPRGVKRKKVPGGGGLINAAPGAGEIDEERDEIRVRKTGPSLLGKLQGVLGSAPTTADSTGKDGTSGNGGDGDDYQSFLAGLEGMQ